MNIYTYKNVDNKLILSVDLSKLVSKNNSEIRLLSQLIVTSINRHLGTTFTQEEIELQLNSKIIFPISSSLYEFEVSKTEGLSIDMKSYHVPGKDLQTQLSYN